MPLSEILSEITGVTVFVLGGLMCSSVAVAFFLLKCLANHSERSDSLAPGSNTMMMNAMLMLYFMAAAVFAATLFLSSQAGRVLNSSGVDGRVVLSGLAVIPFVTFIIWWGTSTNEVTAERWRKWVSVAIIGGGFGALVLTLGAAVPERGHWLFAGACVLSAAWCTAIAHTRHRRSSAWLFGALTATCLLVAGWRLATPLPEEAVAANKLFVMVGAVCNGGSHITSVRFYFLADDRLTRGEVEPLLTEFRKMPHLRSVKGPTEAELPAGFLDAIDQGLNRPDQGDMEPSVFVQDAGGQRAIRKMLEGNRQRNEKKQRQLQEDMGRQRQNADNQKLKERLQKP